MTRFVVRTALVAAATALALSPSVAADPHAGPGASVDTVDTSQAERYWACVAIDHVHVGACLGNPYPDLGKYPSVPDLVRDRTGVRLPAVPRP